jgi:hypothetical protein
VPRRPAAPGYLAGFVRVIIVDDSAPNERLCAADADLER